MRVGDGGCPNSFRATGDNSTAYAGSFGDYNNATASESDDGGDSLDRMLLEIANGDARQPIGRYRLGSQRYRTSRLCDRTAT